MVSEQAELAVVIPVYNEQAIIMTVLNGWIHVLDGLGINYEIHIYDGGSTDGTIGIIHDIMEREARVKLNVYPCVPHGSAIILGYRKNASATWIFQVDSDNEMLPDDFHLLWERRTNYDLLLGRRKYGWRPLLRRIISFLSRIIVGCFYGQGIHYVNAPYRLMRSAMFKAYFDLIPLGIISPNILLSGLACLKHFRICEIEVAYSYRTTGSVAVNVVKMLKVALQAFMQTIWFRFLVK